MKKEFAGKTVGMGLVELYVEIIENPEKGTGACRGNFLNVWGETDHIPLWDLGWRFDYCPGLKGRTVFSNGLDKHGSKPGALQLSLLNSPCFPIKFSKFQIWEPPFF